MIANTRKGVFNYKPHTSKRRAEEKTAGFSPPSEVSFDPSAASGPPSLKRDGKKRLPFQGSQEIHPPTFIIRQLVAPERGDVSVS